MSLCLMTPADQEKEYETLMGWAGRFCPEMNFWIENTKRGPSCMLRNVCSTPAFITTRLNTDFHKFALQLHGYVNHKSEAAASEIDDVAQRHKAPAKA